MIFLIFKIFFIVNAFETIPKLNFEDLKSENTFFIYIYYSKPGIECSLCKAFNKKISEIPMEIKTINFCEAPYLASHFYKLSFPSFVIRHKNKSYVLNANRVDELFNIVNDNKWLEIKPIHWIFDVFSPITKLFSVISYIFYYIVNNFSSFIENIPSFVVNGILSVIIGYLIFSIIEIFKNNTTKIKND